MSKAKPEHAQAQAPGTPEAAPEETPAAAVTAISGEEEQQIDVAELLSELAHWQDTAKRAQAEFDNTKKRLAGQQQAALERASERVVTALLPIMDDLERAIAHAQETGNDLADGMQAIYAKLEAVFGAEGVSILSPLGEPFDHNTAQAVQMVPDTTRPDQTVVEVLQKGYTMSGGARVLRPAMVVVSTAG